MIFSKAVIIKISILAILLVAVTLIFLQQDVEVRLVFDNATLIRNGRSVAVSLDTGDDEWHVIQAETPHYSIYEYNAKVPARIWSQASQVRFEIGQVRVGDELYIESVSVKQPIFKKNVISSGILYDKICEPISTDINKSGRLLVLDVTETRAHTANMNTEMPGFSLPADVMSDAEALCPVYITCVLIITIIWTVMSFLVSAGIYRKPVKRLRDNCREVIDSVDVIDIAILLLGATALIFFHYGRVLLVDYRDLIYRALSLITIALIVFKIIKNKDNIKDEPVQIKENTSAFAYKVLPYIILLLLSAAVYIPAIFPDPYFFTDEHQTSIAASHYLRNGNFDVYNRAWPHTWMLAQVIKHFGYSTVSLRAFSVLCGVVFIVSAYHIIKKLSHRSEIAFLSAVLLLFNTHLIWIFSFVRMYALMLPTSLWLFYCIYMTLHSRECYKPGNRKLRITKNCTIEYIRDNTLSRTIYNKFIRKHFYFSFGYAFVAVFLIWLNFHIHVNAMTYVLCAVVYVFLIAIIKRERKFVIMSIIGISLGALVILVLYLNINTDIRIRLPVVGEFLSNTLWALGLKSGDYRYFWRFIEIPFGAIFGVFFLLAAVASYIFTVIKRNKSIAKKNDYMLYTLICYITATVFFVFFADRYFAYEYMAFLFPVIAMLISTGYYEIIDRVKASAKIVIFILVGVALILQVSTRFSWLYIDKPERTKFARPYQIMANDARNEEQETVYVLATWQRQYFSEYITNGKVIGNVQVPWNNIDEFIEKVSSDNPVIYFFSEQRVMRPNRISAAYVELLDSAAELLTDIDASVVRKFHFIDSQILSNEQDSAEKGGDNTGNSIDRIYINDVVWDNDIAVINCEMKHINIFDGAVFIAVEIIEQGILQSAIHRYQVFVPEGFNSGDVLTFALPVRPKTEEYSGNIAFKTENQIYVYYGEDEAEIY